MLTLDEIRERLKGCRAREVAQAIGVRIATIIDLREGRTENPSYQTIKSLSDYFEDGE